MIKKLIVKRMVEDIGYKYVGMLEHGHSTIVYGVDSISKLYSFWKCEGKTLKILEGGLTRNQAKFKLKILMKKEV